MTQVAVETRPGEDDYSYPELRVAEDLAARHMHAVEERRSREEGDEENMHPDDVYESRYFEDSAQNGLRHVAQLHDTHRYGGEDEDPGELARNNT